MTFFDNVSVPEFLASLIVIEKNSILSQFLLIQRTLCMSSELFLILTAIIFICLSEQEDQSYPSTDYLLQFHLEDTRKKPLRSKMQLQILNGKDMQNQCARFVHLCA